MIRSFLPLLYGVGIGYGLYVVFQGVASQHWIGALLGAILAVWCWNLLMRH